MLFSKEKIPNLHVSCTFFIKCVYFVWKHAYQSSIYILKVQLVSIEYEPTCAWCGGQYTGSLATCHNHLLFPLQVDETDAKMAVANSFTIYGGNRCLVVAASTQEEKDKWQEDLTTAMTIAKERAGDDGGGKMQYASLKSNSECFIATINRCSD